MPSEPTHAQYRLLLEHAPVMVWRSGVDARCDYFNHTWLSWTGRALEEELGEGWTEGVHPDDLQRCIDVYRSHFERRAVFEMEYRLRRHDGVYRYVLDRGGPFYDEQGDFLGFIGSCIDVHERRMEEAARTTFVAMIAHALRTPLQAACNYVDVVREAAARGVPVPGRTLDRLTAQLGRIRKFVRELSDVGLLEQLGSLPPSRREPSDLRGIVREALNLRHELSNLGRASRHVMILDQPETAMQVVCDRSRLVDVIDGILENAVRYSPEGGTIHVTLESDAGWHVVTITDQGIGIPKDEQPKVLGLYVRGSNVSPTYYPGLGIGLAIARQLVEAHGGRISIESELGRGTIVRLMLPVTQERTS